MEPLQTNIQTRLVAFELEGYAMTTEGYKLDRSIFSEEGENAPQYYYDNTLSFKFDTGFILNVMVDCNVHWARKLTGERSGVLASIKTRTSHLLIGAGEFFEGNRYRTFPQEILIALGMDALAATRGAFAVKNMGTPLFDALIPPGGGALLDADIKTSNKSQPEREKTDEHVEVLFDIYEYEDEIIPGMPPVPTFGVEAINHKPHAIRITDHYLEEQIGGEWKKLEHVHFDDHSDRKDWEEGENRYTTNLRKLPKILEPNTRFLWRIIRLPTEKDRRVRGVIVADKKLYYSEPFEYITPKPLPTYDEIQMRKERLRQDQAKR